MSDLKTYYLSKKLKYMIDTFNRIAAIPVRITNLTNLTNLTNTNTTLSAFHFIAGTDTDGD